MKLTNDVWTLKFLFLLTFVAFVVTLAIAIPLVVWDLIQFLRRGRYEAEQ